MTECPNTCRVVVVAPGKPLWDLIIASMGVIREEGKQKERKVGQKTTRKKFEDDCE